MLVAALVKTMLVLAATVGVLAPMAAWIGRRKEGVAGGSAAGPTLAEAEALASSAIMTDADSGAHARVLVGRHVAQMLEWLAPLLAAAPVLSVFVVIPFGGRYRFGDRTLSLVAADVDWGVLYLLAVVLVASFGTVLASWTTHGPRAPAAVARAMTQTMSYGVAFGFSLVPVFMLYGSLRLSEIGEAQQATIPLAALLERVGVSSLLPMIDRFALPAWGIVLNPLAFALCLVSVMAVTGRPPFDRPDRGGGLHALVVTDYSSMGQALARGAEYVQVAMIGGLVTTIFLGGWTIPWLPQQTIIDAITPYVGAGIATSICLLLHLGTFVAKLSFVIAMLVRIRDRIPRLGYERSMTLCWKVVMPLAMIDVLVTAALILTLGGGSAQ
jgi:NADH-quinone oxidoreductase subunit H